MKISVITTHYQRPNHLRLFLHALTTQTRVPDEIIIADDGSDPSCVESIQHSLQNYPIPTQFLWTPHQGFRVAAARNRAIQAASGDYLIFADCDIIYHSTTIAVHAQHATPNGILIGNRALLSQSDTAALFAKPTLPTHEDWDRAWNIADSSELKRAARAFRLHHALRSFHLARPHKPKLLGCNFSMYRNDVLRINGFDENYVEWGYEDDDFVRRLYAIHIHSKSIIHQARALHLWHPSLAPQSSSAYQVRPNRAYFRRTTIPAFCPNGITKSHPLL